MSDDITEKADRLLDDLSDELDQSEGGNPCAIRKNLIDIVPQLVAEIKRLGTDNEFLHKFVDAPGSTLEAVLDEIKRLDGEISDNQIILDCRKETIEELQEQLAAGDLHITSLETMAQATSESHLQFVDAHFAQERRWEEESKLKDIELDNALTDLKHEKERVEVMHLRRENELRQMNELGTKNNDLMSNCNQLRDRCWKAECEIARWQKIAVDKKADEIQDANSGDFIDASGNHIFQVMDIEKCREQAAKELQLQVTQESSYVDRLEKEFLASEEVFYQMVGMVREAKEKAQATLIKIRAGR